ncbi:MAG: DUF3857 and transglutaminase domain-containing protein [Acidobacteriaceae bacterium]
MTSDPAAPNASAVYLYYEEIVDDKLHLHKVYAEVKILTEKGKEDFNEIEMPYESGEATPEGGNADEQSVNQVRGRTIEPDGTVVPFTGKPYQKQLLKIGGEKLMEKVFSLPDVRVGSVIEYEYTRDYESNWYEPPEFDIQRPYYVHQAHFHFVPAPPEIPILWIDPWGHESTVHNLIYFPALPKGAPPVREGLDGFDLVVNDIPALPEEPYSPPLDSFAYRLIFYYSPYSSGQEFWKAEGKVWSKDVNRFADPSDRIKAAVAQIVSSTDTDDQKLQKIYAAVMTVENTDFTREHTRQENKAEGAKDRTAADIWANKRGSSNEITRLFIAMARAAGFKTYAMTVTERNHALLNLGYLSWGDQLTDEIAIVNVNGKEQYFDPGERYCEYGKLDWVHQMMVGIRQTDDGTTVSEAPGGAYTDNALLRTGDLTLGADGAVKGQIRIAMTGAEALRWRQYALSHDEEATKKALEKEVQQRVPAGVQVKMNHFLGLTDSSTNLMAILDVSGSMGTATGKRVFVPAAFFEATEKPIFSAEQRENPIDLHFPYIARDDITLTLAPGLTVDSVPSNASIPYPQMADYQAAYGGKGTVYKQARLLALGNTLYKPEEYSRLRDFFQKVGAQDQQQLVLDRVAVAAGTAAPASGPGAK